MNLLFPPLAQYTQPFFQPLPVWNYWYLLLLPLCLGVAIVYKSIKCASMKQVPRQAAEITFWIILGMGAAAAALAVLVKVLER